jgi:hypothetical protein
MGEGTFDVTLFLAGHALTLSATDSVRLCRQNRPN